MTNVISMIKYILKKELLKPVTEKTKADIKESLEYLLADNER